MAITYDSILNQLKQGEYAPIYFLQGEEPFFIDQIANFIEKNALNESEKGFNQTIMYGKDSSLSLVLNNAKRFPMMSQRQVVIVKEAQEITEIAKIDKENKDARSKAADIFLSYLKNPVPTTILVFCYKYKTIDSRKQLAKSIDSSGILFNSEPVKDYQLKEWISSYVKTQGLSCSILVADLIGDHIGSDLSRIGNEIDKIKYLLGAGSEITADVVHKYIGISKEFNVFEFQDALLSRNIYKSYHIADYFAKHQKENTIQAHIPFIFGVFNKLLMMHSMQNADEKTIISTLNLNFRSIQQYKSAKQKYSFAKTIQIINSIRMADLKSKGVEGSYDIDSIYKELVQDILF